MPISSLDAKMMQTLGTAAAKLKNIQTGVGVARQLLRPFLSGSAGDQRCLAICLGLLVLTIGNVAAGLQKMWSLSAGALAVLGISILSLAWRNRQLLAKQRDLELAVHDRTRQLEIERAREAGQSKLLEMLATGQPLGSILDESLRFASIVMPGSSWVILMRSQDKIRVAAQRNLSAEFRDLLQAPAMLPFEAWHIAKFWPCIPADRAWKAVHKRIGTGCPTSGYSRPIGAQDSRAGVILVFPDANSGSNDDNAAVIDTYARLTRLALEHHLLSEDLHFRAHHDGLTGLPNRLLVQSRLEMAIEEARNTGELLAIVVIDLDGLNTINDSFGQRIGDFLLQEMALRLRRLCRESDTLARLSGDDFSILLRNLRDATEARMLAEACLEAIRLPLALQGETIRATASIGVAIYPAEGNDPESLQRHAEAAMHCAKTSGRNRVQLFSDTNEALDRVRLQDSIRQGLARGYFQIHYQPKHHDDGYLAGFEALARFNHPRLGQVAPAVFIPAAEKGGLIVALGNFVLREVCKQIAKWREEGRGENAVAVNVSSIQLEKADFATNVEHLLDEFQIPPNCLELELTESLLISCTEDCQRQLCRLRALGVRISIDDFGTGYSSLSYLHRLPVDAIKLDRSFVQSIDTDEMSRRLVQAMISVAQRLGLDVIAEGVEREEQRDVLSASGCHLMQGYLFAKPKPAEGLVEVLMSRRATLAIANRSDNLGLLAISSATGTRTLAAAEDTIPV